MPSRFEMFNYANDIWKPTAEMTPGVNITMKASFIPGEKEEELFIGCSEDDEYTSIYRVLGMRFETMLGENEVVVGRDLKPLTFIRRGKGRVLLYMSSTENYHVVMFRISHVDSISESSFLSSESESD